MAFIASLTGFRKVDYRPIWRFYMRIPENSVNLIFSVTSLSKRLPVIIEELPCRKCFHTGKGNFFSIDMIDDQGRRIEYDIFFAASRSLKGGLNLFVQSAYVRDALHASSRPHQKPIGFLVILFNTLNNRPIKLPPK